LNKKKALGSEVFSKNGNPTKQRLQKGEGKNNENVGQTGLILRGQGKRTKFAQGPKGKGQKNRRAPPSIGDRTRSRRGAGYGVYFGHSGER